jgi:hypothetical protein
MPPTDCAVRSRFWALWLGWLDSHRRVGASRRRPRVLAPRSPIRSRPERESRSYSAGPRCQGAPGPARRAHQPSGKSASSRRVGSLAHIRPRPTTLASAGSFVVPLRNCQLPSSASCATRRIGAFASRTWRVVIVAVFGGSAKGQVSICLRVRIRSRGHVNAHQIRRSGENEPDTAC